jgi:glycosyltransferase involved in cell wall biosynthesis
MSSSAGSPFAPSLTLVIPAFNEAENLPIVLPQAREFVTTHCRDGRLLIVDDGSADATPQVLSAYANDPHVRLIRHERNRGLTATLRTGFFAAESEYVTWIPADGQIPLPEVAKILAASDGADLTLSTYRRRPDGVVRATMSKTVRLLMQAATGLRDRIEGPYLFRRRLLDELDLVSQTSAGSIGLEIAVKARLLGKRITTTEIECAPRLAGHSKVANLRNIATYFLEIWRIRRSLARGRGPGGQS